MARKKQPRVIKASSINSVNPEPTREKRDITNQITKWVPFFKDTNNLYVNDLALRYRRSATMASIINSKTNYTIGSEWIYLKDGDVQEEADDALEAFVMNANNDMQDLKDVFKDMCFNWITFGNVYIEVSRAKIKGTQSFASNIYVHDATKCRINKSKDTVYISSFWRDIKNNVQGGEYPAPTEVPMWDKKIDTKQTNFIIHVKRNTPEYDYYGLPDYVATLKDCDIEYQVDTYNLTRLENGFFPSSIVSMFGEPPEGMNDKQYIDALKNKYSGASNSGEPLFQLLDSADQAAQVTEFSGAKEGEFTALEDSAKKGILQGHRWFPALAGIETSGKLGGNQEIINQWRVVMETVVKPDYQQPMLRTLNRILDLLGFDMTLDVLNVPPVGIEDRINISDVLDKNEQREALGFEPLDELEEEVKETEEPIIEEDGDND